MNFRIGRTMARMCRPSQIRKCGAFDPDRPDKDRNLSGLAVTLIKRERDGRDQIMILPGDCPFDRIPRLPAGRIVGVVAYHHGAGAYWSAQTTGVLVDGGRHVRWVYSFGHNRYGHPRRGNYDAVCAACNAEARSTPQARADGEFAQDVSWHSQSGW
ncbi:MAG TPA: hypothetical protein VLF18_18850 [Tahibacter sp.]|uniref:hypothetical protein n=1 Tax=Tahibacter sp. TaxID=2056211 RepID=UPI002CC2214D|nr:hypothetical protein [Tahibacter sp.]HSX62247.1 hypothetical protein [Tahibacter sp.]